MNKMKETYSNAMGYGFWCNDGRGRHPVRRFARHRPVLPRVVHQPSMGTCPCVYRGGGVCGLHGLAAWTRVLIKEERTCARAHTHVHTHALTCPHTRTRARAHAHIQVQRLAVPSYLFAKVTIASFKLLWRSLVAMHDRIRDERYLLGVQLNNMN